jgi:hypothetical protein
MILSDDRIGPGTGHKLIDSIKTSINKSNKEDPFDLLNPDIDELKSRVDSFRMASPYLWKPETSPFSFMSNSSLAGLGNPCAHSDCRLSRIRDLSKFATLYADTIIIPDPFDEFLESDGEEFDRVELLFTLIKLLDIAPLIESGIVVFGPKWFPLCEEGKKQFIKFEENTAATLINAANVIENELLTTLSFSKTKHSDNAFTISIDHCGEYVSTDQIDVLMLDKLSRSLVTDNPELTEEEKRHAIKSFIIDPAINDLQYRELMRWLYNAKYLSDRPADSLILNQIDGHHQTIQQDFASAITHSLPFIENLDTKTILKLRTEEGEAFNLYRDKVKDFVDGTPVGSRPLKDAFNDLIRPELNKIDSAVKNARSMVKDSIREDLIFGVGAVTIGISIGIVAPKVGAAVSFMGGSNYLLKILKGYNSLLREVPAAKENDFYFLWKARGTR